MSAPSDALLKWYDASARDLPWRVAPAERRRGRRPDPYRVWLSEVMLQQTTVATVGPRYEAFLARWPTVEALAAASLDDVLGEWAGLGYYARARNLHKCARAVATLGHFPDTEEALRALPGIGEYTAAAIAAIAFDRRAVVMDGNIERVAARLFAIATPLPKAKPELKAAIGAVWPQKRSGDFAQALMDLGAGVCSPRAPQCPLCPLAEHCSARAKGVAATLPAKSRKIEKPTRFGVVYALFNEKGEVLFERRPEKGLLGGMLGLPGTAWMERSNPRPLAGEGGAKRRVRGRKNEPPAGTGARSLTPGRSDVWSDPAIAGEGSAWRFAGTVRHTFTHFHLELVVMTARAAKRFATDEGLKWLAPDKTRLPTVMKKAVERALTSTDHPRGRHEKRQFGHGA